jgi:HK97 gp10 family phage protein
MELVTGAKELNRILRDLPKNLQKRAINKAASKAAQVIVKQAKSDATVGATGAMKRNIKKEAWRSRYYAKTFAIGVAHGKVPENVGEGIGVSENSKGKLSIKKLSAREKRGEDPYYFRWVELGWHHSTVKDAKNGDEIKAQPFLGPSVTKAAAQATRVYGNELKLAIDKLGKPA